jgi:hypothetical protein
MNKKDIKALSDYLKELQGMSIPELKKENLKLNMFKTSIKKLTIGQSKGPAGKRIKKKKSR